MKKILCCLFVFIFSLTCISCSKEDKGPKPNPDDPFYGTWYYDDEFGMRTYYEFDGIEKAIITFMDISDICKYVFDSTTLTVITKRDEHTFTHIYEYSFEGEYLSLTEDGKTIKLLKDSTAG